MVAFEIEAWARKLTERILGGGQAEDARVEVKSDWPSDHRDIARRIGAMCNAARRAPVLLLIGVDEKSHRVTGAKNIDMASWWGAVKSHFDSSSPVMHEHAFDYVPAQTIVGIQFDTDAVPYVVKTGIPGAITHEVPWREGTRVRSALRGDLLKILLPLESLPLAEVVEASITHRHGSESQSKGPRFEFVVHAFVDPRSARLTIPSHQFVAGFRSAAGGDWSKVESAKLEPWDKHSPMVQKSGNDLVLLGPCLLKVQAVAYVPLSNLSKDSDVEVQLRFRPAGHHDDVVVRETVPRTKAPLIWEFRPQPKLTLS
jgi:hypothetical protein